MIQSGSFEVELVLSDDRLGLLEPEGLKNLREKLSSEKFGSLGEHISFFNLQPSYEDKYIYISFSLENSDISFDSEGEEWVDGYDEDEVEDDCINFLKKCTDPGIEDDIIWSRAWVMGQDELNDAAYEAEMNADIAAREFWEDKFDR